MPNRENAKMTKMHKGASFCGAVTHPGAKAETHCYAGI